MYDWYFGKHRTPSDLREARAQMVLGISGMTFGFVVFFTLCVLWLCGIV